MILICWLLAVGLPDCNNWDLMLYAALIAPVPSIVVCLMIVAIAPNPRRNRFVIGLSAILGIPLQTLIVLYGTAIAHMFLFGFRVQ